MSVDKKLAKARLSSALEYIKYIHNYEYEQLGTEEDVKIKIVIPFLKSLQIDMLHCDFERRTQQGKRTDIVIPYGNEEVIVEIKRRQITLKHDHIEQLRSYLYSEQSKIGILTNGRSWQFYTYQNGVMKLIESLDLSYYTSEDEQEFLLNFNPLLFDVQQILNYENV